MPLHQPFAKKQQAFPIIRKKKWQELLKVPWLPIED